MRSRSNSILLKSTMALSLTYDTQLHLKGSRDHRYINVECTEDCTEEEMTYLSNLVRNTGKR